MTLSQLALAIGLSPRLLGMFLNSPEEHYREFTLPKKGGGDRLIHAPRLFLKTTQYWLGTYVLNELKVHDSCYAYIRGRSIFDNASRHVRQKYVANLDIQQFFDSVQQLAVRDLLIDNGVGRSLSSLVSGLVTFQSTLPQGAPTSPLISNAFLYCFDEKVSTICNNLGITYTRYADDISLSGDNRETIGRVVRTIRSNLQSYGLKINEKKTRISSAAASQRVTGLVVNEGVRPPRTYRRLVRAEFHRAALGQNGIVSRDTWNRLRGHVSYLQSFPLLSDTHEVEHYRQVLAGLKLQQE